MASNFVNDCVRAMNVYRSFHQVSALTHNPQITSIAQAWADRLAASGSLSHNTNASYRGENLGENCAMRWTSDRQEVTGQQVADQWYSEVERYDFKKHSGPKTGHFTQVVWKSSREVGIGRSVSRDGKCFVVANFYPAGNYIGHNAENVLPTRDGKIQLPAKTENATPAVAKPGGGGSKVTSGGGESVKTEVHTETIGRGPTAVTRTTTVETRTGPDGRTHTTRTVKETRGIAESTANEPNIASLSLKDKAKAGSEKVVTDNKFAADVLRCHNVYRNKHGRVESLVLNAELMTEAQQWAEHLASVGALKHSNAKYQGQPVGENVAAKSGSGQVDYTGQELVDQWYSEQPKFNYNRPEDASESGHFTQVVWKSSQQLGVGKAKSPDGRQVFVVCMYYPAGNYRGRYKENVMQPR